MSGIIYKLGQTNILIWSFVTSFLPDWFLNARADALRYRIFL